MVFRKHNSTAGFSLIEVIVGIAMLGLVTVPVCASLVLSVRLNSHAQSLMTAQLQAAGAVETLLAEGFDPDELDAIEVDGVEVDYVDKTNYYEVTVHSTVNGETVAFKTSVPVKGGGTE